MAIYNVVEQNRASTQSGLALGAQMFNNSLRMQQLRSQQALQQLQERQLAQEMALRMEAHDLQVQERAELAKASARFQMLTSPELPMQVPVAGPPTANGPALGTATVAVPNPNLMAPEDAFMQTIGQTITKFRPEKSMDLLADYAAVKRQRAMAQFQPHAEPIDLGGGQVMQGIRTSPNTWTPVGSGDPETKVENGRTFRRNRFGDWVPLTATSEEVGKRQTGQKFLAEALKLDPSQVKMDEAGNAIITPETWSKLSKLGSVTTGTRSNLEASALSSAKLVENGRKLLPLINEQTTGVKGELTRLAQSTGLSMVVPGLENPKVAEADAYGRAFTADVIKSLRSDGNINKDEVTRLEQASNTINWTTPREGKARLSVFLGQARELGRRTYQTLGTAMPPQYMTLEEIAAIPNISDEEAATIYNKTIESLIKQARREAGL